MADVVKLSPGETDLGRIVAAIREIQDRFGASEDAALGALLAANNLSDLTDASDARDNLGLGSAAVLDDTEVFQVANNLSEGTDATMRSNLGLAYGLQTIWVPAAGMTGIASAPPEIGSYNPGNGILYTTLDFDQTTQEAAAWAITMPKSWDK